MSDFLPSGQQKICELRMVNITKRFPGVLANDNVSFDVNAGEIHALLGENGAGKSTLMRQLYGFYQPDSGQVLIDDVEHRIQSPKDSIAAGIGMVHQHFMLVRDLTVVENIALGLKSSKGFVLDLDRVRQRTIELGETYGLRVDPDACIWQLAVGEQQRVEIIKALYRGASVLILDEPTAVLTPQEVKDLFKIFKQMARDGHALIFISHKLNEVLEISNRITVLRDGKVVGELPTTSATTVELAHMMVGRPVFLKYDCPPLERDQIVILELEDIHVVGDRGTEAVKGISLDLRTGEILGLAGVSGNGQTELAESLAGLRPIREGKLLLNGKDITHTPPGARINAGLSYIPEERMRVGVIKDFSVAENYILEDHHKPPYSQSSFLNFKVISSKTREAVEQFNIKTPTIDTPIKNLSGGNIQKLILARELARAPKVLIAAQPTRGVDIGATEYIHKKLIEQRCSGTTTLLISEDLDEIRALSDRIAVMNEGKLMGIVNRGEATIEELGLMMAGVKRNS